MSLFDKLKAGVSSIGGSDKEKKPEIPKNYNSGKLIKQGELKKLGGSRGGWKLWQDRWFVLRETGLAYFESEKDYKKSKAPKGYDVINDIKPVDGINKENEFYFISPDRKVLVCAKNPQMMNEWLAVLALMKSAKTTVHELTVEELFDSKSNSGAAESSTEGFLEVQAANMPWEQAGSGPASNKKNSDVKQQPEDNKPDEKSLLAMSEDEKMVTGPIKGSEQQLLALLTNPTSEITFRNAFFMQHTSFMSSDTVMQHLETVYDRKPADYSTIIGSSGGSSSSGAVPSTPRGRANSGQMESSSSQSSAGGDSKQCLTHKLHVLGILCYWAENYMDDLAVPTAAATAAATAATATSPTAAAAAAAASNSATATAASGTAAAGVDVKSAPSGAGARGSGSSPNAAGVRLRKFMEKNRDLKNESNDIHTLFPRAAVTHLLEQHARLEAAFAKAESDHLAALSTQDTRRAARAKARESGSGGGGSLALTAEQRAMNLGADANVGEFQATNIAAQLTLLDFDLFKMIRARELTRKEWTRKETCHVISPNILHMVDNFNERSFWVASEILLREDDKERIHMMKKMINAAFECLNLHNFYSAFAIMNGLSLGPVHRLQHCWAAIPNNSRERYAALKEMASSSKNYPNYRKLYQAGMGKAQIPHLMIVLKDLFQLEEVPTVDKEKNNMINWHKYWKEYKIVSDLQFCQTLTYHNLKNQPQLIIALQAGHSRVLSEAEMFTKSYQYEAKGAGGFTGGAAAATAAAPTSPAAKA